jgi:hypothetical protein
MKQTSKQFLRTAAVAALVLGVAGGVLARGGFGAGGPGWGMHDGMMGGPARMHRGYGGPGWTVGADPAAYAEQRLEQLKTTLDITPEQETAWNTYSDAVKGKAGLMTNHRQARFAGTITPEERLSFHQEGLAQMQTVMNATRDLHAVLTPEQRVNAGGLMGPRCRAW